ncbi:MAG: ABC-F type ribosomal protection protein [Oscillospiraceae bacterium]|nr:ABC-F type ribosomal protection protein [Oscillospiraceae bacterium]
MSQINISNLTFAYDGASENVFENVSFSIDTDWKLGFTGRNGRGKTTFMKLLMKKYEYSGSISSSVNFEYFPYNIQNTSMLTMYIIDEICPDCENWRILKELAKLDINEDVLYRPFCTLSNGEQTKILICAMFLKENSFMLIDEPTNHLDTKGRILLSKYLNSKKGFILISHDRDFLDGCTDHTLSINRNNIEVCKGNFSAWYQNKQMQDNSEISQNQKLKKDIKRLEKSFRQSAEWSDKAEKCKIGFDPAKTEKNINRRPNEGAKSKKMMSRAKAIQSRQSEKISEKSSLLKNIEISDSLKLSPLKYHSGNLVSLRSISIEYDSKIICRNVNLTLKNGECVALCGKNGCGKSSIIRLICGENIKYSGDFYKGSQLKISYVPQNISGISGSIADFAMKSDVDESLLKSILFKLGFERNQLSKDISELSEGQRKKVILASSLCTQAHLYIWDEPLNFIDVISRIQIENLIKVYKPSMILVEHDNAFIKNVCDNIINL